MQLFSKHKNAEIHVFPRFRRFFISLIICAKTNSPPQYPDKEKGRLKTEFGFSDDLFAWGSESGEGVASGLRLGMPFSVGVFLDGGTHAGSIAAVHEHDRFAVEGVAVAAVVGDDCFVVVQL